jgi:predicted CXXCH cytochrome family protein
MPVNFETYGQNATCLACHPSASADARSNIALMHPTDAEDNAHGLPVATQLGGGEMIGCRTCHDPHRGGAVESRLLRINPGEDRDALCLKCHVNQAGVLRIGHAPDTLVAAGFDHTQACQPCHSVHGDPANTEPRFLWSRDLDAEPTTTSPRFAPTRHCVACHRVDGPVAPPAIATHPAADMFNPFQASDTGYLPLFGADGTIDPSGNITCLTCHLTHGHATTTPQDAKRFGELPPRERRARQWHLRSFGPSSVCTTCHGSDALRRFMYFHDAARRTGPIQP